MGCVCLCALSIIITHWVARYWNVDFINRTSLNDPMADCCSSSETLPESWQVFINFRGKELRSGFISHLERGLNDAEIKYYVDTKEKILASFSLGSSSPKSLCPSSRACTLNQSGVWTSWWRSWNKWRKINSESSLCFSTWHLRKWRSRKGSSVESYTLKVKGNDQICLIGRMLYSLFRAS